jgi:2-C-methyl-D-erythritol 4-phosphate cytidylyltransferase/2-C-methyl-D-erythritol 2,4-cyclodiphosphate synthase
MTGDLKEPDFVSVLIVAAGQGSRFGGLTPKTLELLAGKPVLAWAMEPFRDSLRVKEIVLVVPNGQEEFFRSSLNLNSWDLPVKIVPGGEYRIQSVAQGFQAISPKASICLIHDGARPLVTSDEVLNVIKAVEETGAAILAAKVQDTLKLVADDGTIVKTVDRQGVWRAQTPQGFKRDLLAKALEVGLKTPEKATDEAISLEEMGYKVTVVSGSERNIKITTPGDLALAESLAGSLLKAEPKTKGPGIPDPSGLRVGEGWDFHRFNPQRPLWLGGILIKDGPGLEGHSDADVLAHALVDALLGAAGLGDIGEMFPVTDKWRGVSGATLISITYASVLNAGYELVNADLTLIGETPRIAPYRQEMILALAKALGLAKAKVSLKATTTEKMGFTGRGEGLAATAIVLLKARAS